MSKPIMREPGYRPSEIHQSEAQRRVGGLQSDSEIEMDKFSGGKPKPQKRPSISPDSMKEMADFFRANKQELLTQKPELYQTISETAKEHEGWSGVKNWFKSLYDTKTSDEYNGYHEIKKMLVEAGKDMTGAVENPIYG